MTWSTRGLYNFSSPGPQTLDIDFNATSTTEKHIKYGKLVGIFEVP